MIDPVDLKNCKCTKTKQFMFIKELNDNIDQSLENHIIYIPAGKYLCFFSDKKMSRPTPVNARKKLNESSFVIATEFENRLGEYGETLRLEFEIFLA